MSYLEKVCKEKGLAITEDNKSVAQFSTEELESDWKSWNEYGRANLQSRILPIRAMTTLEIEE